MTQLPPILVSACLMGENVRYDAKHSLCEHPALLRWKAQGRLVVICPEMAGGLPTPRPPCERDQTSGRIVSKDGEDFTIQFDLGAQKALALVQQHEIRFALLKARSPSCGAKQVYDGQFHGQLIPGAGVTAQLLMDQGVDVYNENEIDQLALRLEGDQSI